MINWNDAKNFSLTSIRVSKELLDAVINSGLGWQTNADSIIIARIVLDSVTADTRYHAELVRVQQTLRSDYVWFVRR